MRRSTNLVLAVSVLAAANICATESSTNRLPEVVVTSTRLPETDSTTPTVVTVITREQIEQNQARTVREILSQEVGITVAARGQPGGQASVFMRGANSDQTLVLIDGIRINSPYNNAFDFANLPVDNIERIEILRGPQSTLYGSEAMGGVINIVTRRGTGPMTGSALVEAGSYNSFLNRNQFSASSGKLAVAVEGGYLTTDNTRPNSEYQSGNVSGRASYQFLDRLSASLLGSYVNTHAGSPGDIRGTGVTEFDPNDYLNNENILVALTLDGQPTEWWDATLKLSHAHEHAYFSQLQPNPTSFLPPWDNLSNYTQRTITDRNQVDFQNVFSLTEQHRFLLGGAFDHSRAVNTSTYGGTERTLENWAGYMQYEFTPVSRFTTTIGGRVDDYTTFGTHGTYRFGARWTTPVTETILRGNIGSGFRAPSVVQLSTEYGGNPNLQPEESLGWDIGFEQPLSEGKLRVGATYFQNEFDHLIISVPAPPPIYSQLANTGRARTLGIESHVVWMPLTNLTVRGAYTWLAQARDLSADAPLLLRPEHSGSVSIDYQFLQRFSANANAVFAGKRPDRNFNTGSDVMNDGYIKIGLGLKYEICRYFTAFARVENLFDDHYEEVYGYPALGRTFWGGGSVKF